jgi:hypothetical protein
MVVQWSNAEGVPEVREAVMLNGDVFELPRQSDLGITFYMYKVLALEFSAYIKFFLFLLTGPEIEIEMVRDVFKATSKVFSSGPICLSVITSKRECGRARVFDFKLPASLPVA